MNSLPLHESFARVSNNRGAFRTLLKSILAERPDLRGQMAYFPEQGARAYTVIIGDEVFKAPRQPNDYLFPQEADNLKRLAGRGLPVPRVTCERRGLFYGMTRLPGVTLDSVFDKLTPPQMQALAEDIAEAIIGMAQATKRLSPQGTEYGMHDDLHTENVLVDPQTGRLTGVVDFGYFDFLLKERLVEHSGLMLDGRLALQVRGAVARRAESLAPAPSPYIIREIPNKGATL